ncbi:hypothetical protein K505DRAFT_413816 [Melanomma pulvis-pyrius CBS 109.77]|uniref:Arrestin-like N-terminal domain-containing protein n=1 Tax=Melanomma pulvis-pyrius CBS 109.77 TaxID=1314802 RepID=A0A6A6XSI3_9PLEO|nr:hypothetical protein K505DRAFT_413816 [Melanomma pulvis-pyrius CBS 109.77]
MSCPVIRHDARVISIQLPEDRNCSYPGRSGYCFCAVRTGGDILKGEITFLPALSTDSVIDVLIFWKFLQQVESIKFRPRSKDESTIPFETHKIPFKFDIPNRLPVASDAAGLDPRLRELCPSMTAGRLYEQGANRKPYMQPMIFYRLSASARPEGREPQRPRVGVAREITIMPTTESLPPTYTSAFKKEYRLQATSKIRKHFFGRSQGSLEIAAEEPQPINMLKPYPRSNTVINLKASFEQGENVLEHTVEPYYWTFQIRTRLQRRLFYSTKPFNQAPTLADAQSKSYIRLQTQVLQSEEREYMELPWRNGHVLPNGTIISTDRKASRWTVMIPVVFTTDHSLIPSFFSETVALRYSVLLNVRILGSVSAHSTLEIPLQVIRFSPSLSKDSIPLSSLNSFQLLSVDDERGVDSCSEPTRRPPKYRRWAY